MEKRKLLYEGSAKEVYLTEDPDLVILHFKDDATAFSGIKKAEIAGKGIYSNKISGIIFERLEKKGRLTTPTFRSHGA
jgi:phosphoribosylaminoimidazole-succinocarboxamide synthase